MAPPGRPRDGHTGASPRMDGSLPAADAPPMAAPSDAPPAPAAFAWRLAVANLAVANAIGLLAGLGGLRTPWTGANLVLCALLVAWPWQASLARSLAPMAPLTGRIERIQQAAFVAVVSLAALPVVAASVWVLGFALLWLTVGLVAVASASNSPPGVPPGLPYAQLAVTGALALAAAAPWPRPDRRSWLWPWRLARLAGHATPCLWLGVIAFAALWTPGAFAGDDPMHEPIAAVPAPGGRVEALRVNGAAFLDYAIRIDRVRELGPALEWRARLDSRGDCGDATLSRDGDGVRVRYASEAREVATDARGRPRDVLIPLR